VLIDKDGLKHTEGKGPIGFRTAYIRPSEGLYVLDSDAAVNSVNKDRLLAPMSTVVVESSLGGYDVTDSDGFYWMSHFLPSCHGFEYNIANLVMAKFPYIKANPKIRRPGDFVPVIVSSSVGCTSENHLFELGKEVNVNIVRARLESQMVANIPVDVLMLTGSAYLTNKYDNEGRRVLVGDQQEDDLSVKLVGPVEDKTIYAYDPYSKEHLVSKGLLERISKKDLANTDLYVFRESDGKMLGERKGFPVEFISEGAYSDALIGGDGIRRLNFQHLLPGFRVSESTVQGGVRIGENIRLVLINRATGYMASRTIKAEPSSAASNSIEIRIKDIEMRPPNLKISVLRKFDPFIHPELKIALCNGFC